MTVTLSAITDTVRDEARRCRYIEAEARAVLKSDKLVKKLLGGDISDKLVRRIVHDIVSRRMRNGRPAERSPEAQRKSQDRKDAAQAYRRGPVRKRARIAHLANGFMKGRAYSEMEAKSYTPPPWQTAEVLAEQEPCPITALLLEAAHPYDTEARSRMLQQLAQWKDEAGTWKHPNGTERASIEKIRARFKKP